MPSAESPSLEGCLRSAGVGMGAVVGAGRGGGGADVEGVGGGAEVGRRGEGGVDNRSSTLGITVTTSGAPPLILIPRVASTFRDPPVTPDAPSHSVTTGINSYVLGVAGAALIVEHELRKKGKIMLTATVHDLITAPMSRPVRNAKSSGVR